MLDKYTQITHALIFDSNSIFYIFLIFRQLRGGWLHN
jgi:hypothetical protein